jgi:hypothetical protein
MGWHVMAILIGVLLILLIGVAIMINRRYNRRPNYKVLFIIGITWIPLGIAIGNYVFSAAGLVMMIAGLAKRKEWREEPKWGDLPPEVKKIKLFIIGVIMIILLSLIVMLLLQR